MEIVEYMRQMTSLYKTKKQEAMDRLKALEEQIKPYIQQCPNSTYKLTHLTEEERKKFGEPGNLSVKSVKDFRPVSETFIKDSLINFLSKRFPAMSHEELIKISAEFANDCWSSRPSEQRVVVRRNYTKERKRPAKKSKRPIVLP
jgi:hypothetical protein